MNNVMNIRKIFFIVKHFYKSRKNVMRIISATMISVFLIMVTLLIIKTNESAILNELFDTYGKYTVSIDEEALPRFNEIQEDSKVKDFITFFQSEYKIDEFIYTNYYAKPEIIEFKNIKLVDGHLPKYDNEIAVERNYLFNLGLTEEEMIGSIISFPTSENGKEEQLLVTGIIMLNEAVQGRYEENSVTAIFSERDVQPNQLLIQVISINDYMEILDYITKKYNINEDTCYVNFDLFTALGITTGDNTFQINEQYYIFLFSMIVVCTIVII